MVQELEFKEEPTNLYKQVSMQTEDTWFTLALYMSYLLGPDCK